MHGTLATGFSVEISTLGELAAVTSALRELVARACEPNIFYEPDFVAAAARVFGHDVRAALVWRAGAERTLAGFFPVRLSRRRYGLKIPVAVGWTHPYAPLGVPLIDRECAEAVVAAWLNHLASDPALPKLLLMPYLSAMGAVARTFDMALARRGGRFADFAVHERALLAPEAPRADYLARSIPRKHRKERQRQRQRLADVGPVSSVVAREPQAIAVAVEQFLALEAGGWKGRAGTAAANDAKLRGLLSNAVNGLARNGKARVATLSVGGRAAAAAIVLQSGDTAWIWKTAYDEAFARASPGVQILLDVTQALLDDASIARVDSCATAGHPMIDHIWRERLLVTDRLIGIGPDCAVAFVVAHACETLRRTAEASARKLRTALRGK